DELAAEVHRHVVLPAFLPRFADVGLLDLDRADVVRLARGAELVELTLQVHEHVRRETIAERTDLARSHGALHVRELQPRTGSETCRIEVRIHLSDIRDAA